MKISVGFVFLCLAALAVSKHPYKVANKEFLERQKDVLTLFSYINQPTYYKEHLSILEKWDWKNYENHFTKPEYFKKFWQYYHYDAFLPRGEIFSVFNYHHVEQVKVLFDMFYYAKDFETFYNFAVWARQYINEGMFLYTVSVAIVHRPDTYGIVIPPIYEIYPYYFFGSEVIEKAQYYKQIYHGEQQDGYHTIWANYSGDYLNLHPEQSMSYYLEDVGINNFYYYFNLYYPYWMSAQEYNFVNDKRGELYLYFYQQILARYYLERLSNDFGEIPYFNWEVPFETYYYPSMHYHNGLAFPSRPKFANLYEYFYNYGQSWTMKSKYGYSYTYSTEYEKRIHEAIDFGYYYDKSGEKFDLYKEGGINVLGNLIQGNPDSPHPQYYGALQVFARHLLGYSFQPLDHYHLAPSALEHFETSMRDPAFYQLYKKIVYYYFRYMSHVKPYTKTELYFPGVEVTDVKFDRLVTYFDTFDSDISNGVYVTPEEYVNHKFKVYARQYRLNHKPFNYYIHVKSDKPVKAAVKIFLGPKYDEYGRFINISQNHYNFVEFDYFTYDLKAGDNQITRSSHENPFYGPDRTSYHELYKTVMGAYNGQGEFHLDGYQQYFYFPKRYMLPMGKEYGMHYQFFVYVYPFEEYKGHHEHEGEYYYPRVGSGSYMEDNYPFGYPFNRFIEYEKLWYDMPNGYFYEAPIYHTPVHQIQSTVHH
ncbi:hexamerin-1.1-like isoform X2 [Aethina tumida]|uniref:hexamerin-1.1-like isoform X2 n=1 Tax=Aethina tumida TaxID=116153 RepID=UPI002148E0AE|nr:hexamerin-1.1-like isoform X2 [Aethina tumida]